MANWIVRFLAAIAVHKSNASAHHAKYTDAEVLVAVQRSGGIFWWNNNWLPAGMISSSTGGTGSVSWYDYDLWLATGGTADSYAHVEKSIDAPLPYSWDKKRHFRADVLIVKKQTQNLHVATGKVPNTGSGNIFEHIGFVINGDVLLGTVANGTTESIRLLETLVADGQARILEAIFTPGVEARFYVDGVDKGAITTNLPSGSFLAKFLFGATANNLSAYTKQLWVRQVRVLQEG